LFIFRHVIFIIIEDVFALAPHAAHRKLRVQHLKTVYIFRVDLLESIEIPVTLRDVRSVLHKIAEERKEPFRPCIIRSCGKEPFAFCVYTLDRLRLKRIGRDILAEIIVQVLPFIHNYEVQFAVQFIKVIIGIS